MPYEKTSERKLFPGGCSGFTAEEFKQFWDETAESYDDFVAEHATECHKLVPQLLLSYEQKFNVKVSSIPSRSCREVLHAPSKMPANFFHGRLI